MGFQIPKREAVITFEGTDFDGAEVRCKLDVPLRMYLDIMRAESHEQTEAVNRQWAEDVLIAWNLEDDGAEIPANAEGFLSLPPVMVNSIVARWLEQAAGVDVPLVASSNGTGERSPAGTT